MMEACVGLRKKRRQVVKTEGGGGLTKTAKLKRMWKGTEEGNNTKVGKSNKAKR